MPVGTLWVDLLEPAPFEVRDVEQRYGVSLPSRLDMLQIELSNRLYQRDGATYLIIPMVWKSDTGAPETTPMAVVWCGEVLLTLRYTDPDAPRTFAAAMANGHQVHTMAPDVLIGLLRAIVERTADVLERAGFEQNKLSGDIFSNRAGKRKGHAFDVDLEQTLRALGRLETLTALVRESLIGLLRTVSFLSLQVMAGKPYEKQRLRLKYLQRDIQALSEHAEFLANKGAFLLDATLGLINVQQNKIIKTLSIATTVFLPPTFIGTVYGMNFTTMPELTWPWGYPVALLVMLLSAALPYLYFRHRGWM